VLFPSPAAQRSPAQLLHAGSDHGEIVAMHELLSLKRRKLHSKSLERRRCASADRLNNRFRTHRLLCCQLSGLISGMQKQNEKDGPFTARCLEAQH